MRTETVEEFVGALEKPRRVLIMVKAGALNGPAATDIDDAASLCAHRAGREFGIREHGR